MPLYQCKAVFLLMTTILEAAPERIKKTQLFNKKGPGILSPDPAIGVCFLNLPDSSYIFLQKKKA